MRHISEILTEERQRIRLTRRQWQDIEYAVDATLYARNEQDIQEARVIFDNALDEAQDVQRAPKGERHDS